MRQPTISRRIGRFAGDRRVLVIFLLLGLFVAARTWLAAHPQHNPWAPLDLRHSPGLATGMKFAALKEDVPECRAVLGRSDIAFTALPGTGEGPCLRQDRTRLEEYPLSPASPAVTCPVAAALVVWRRNTLEPAAREIFGSELQSIEHLGAYSCRRLYGREDGAYSEHATGNAIDISGFRLANGTRISVLNDWSDGSEKGLFLRRAREGACDVFATVLSPDYNAAHADHFHFDQSLRWRGVCR